VTSLEEKPIRDYLQNVEARLARLPIDERSAIIDNLEAQIRDSLEARCQGAAPTPDDVAAVLTELDSPEAFDDERPLSSGATPRSGILGWVALIISLTGWAFAIFVATRPGSHNEWYPIITLLLSQLIALSVAGFSKGGRMGRVFIALSLLILICFLLLISLSQSGA